MKFLKRLFQGDPTLRSAHYAGRVYPSDAVELETLIRAAFDKVGEAQTEARAVVVPHSDPRLCADLVASALACLADDVARVVMLGPSRRVPFRGVAATSAEGWDSPLGWLRVDREAYAPIAELPVARQLEDAHAAESCLELLVPYLRLKSEDVSILPVLVGDASIGDLATVIDRLWTEDTAVVVACELSEGMSAADAIPFDEETARHVVSGKVEALDDRQMSGRRIVQALLEIADERGLSVTQTGLKNSSQLGGPADHTVGYGAFVVS